MSDDEAEWIKQFTAALNGEYNTLPYHMPPRIRVAAERAVARDGWARMIDCQRAHLAGTLARMHLP